MPNQHSGDDSAINSICMYCNNGMNICSTKGGRGSWHKSDYVSGGFVAGNVRHESKNEASDF